MATIYLSFWYSLALFAICLGSFRRSSAVANEERKDYIAYMGALPSNAEYSPKAHHVSMLQEVVNGGYVRQSLIRSYTRSFNGFAAHLTEEEARKLSTNEHVVSIFPSKIYHLYTTNSWNFVEFSQTVHHNLSIESDIIIGVLDSGIWPESESFKDDGFGPIPKKWKGECKGGKDFTCNKKIIGARTYVSDSCRDLVGHGSHTGSTAAGNNVKNVSFYGIAQGTARGAVPSARIAAYKVCGDEKCGDVAIMGGFDDAIADGVDILSVSLGGDSSSLQSDVVAIGSFHASEKGILTVQAVGNNGPDVETVASHAPWLFSVAASTTDRKIFTKVLLGNGTELLGDSVNSFELNGTQSPIVFGADGAVKGCHDIEMAKRCYCLDKKLVQGKIVVCNISGTASQATEARALGMISLPESGLGSSYIFPLATSTLNYQQINTLASYYNSTKSPTMNILKSEAEKDSGAPVVAGFSSRGPSSIVPDILKPDITAPGVQILAAFSPKSPPSPYSMDKRSVSYSILSGTSMACPHVTGAAAYVKSLHPEWSPSAIKSALMTTASRMNGSGDNEFSYGAGHLNPVKATDPGILYETSGKDYIRFLCGMNITSSMAAKITGYNITCTGVEPIKPKDLNYPSMAAQIDKNNVNGAFKVEFPRRITNVGHPNSTYKANINQSSPCNITVLPNILSFKKLNEQKSFIVIVTGEKLEEMISASLEWSDGIHVARSPIVVFPPML